MELQRFFRFHIFRPSVLVEEPFQSGLSVLLELREHGVTYNKRKYHQAKRNDLKKVRKKYWETSSKIEILQELSTKSSKT